MRPFRSPPPTKSQTNSCILFPFIWTLVYLRFTARAFLRRPTDRPKRGRYHFDKTPPVQDRTFNSTLSEIYPKHKGLEKNQHNKNLMNLSLLSVSRSRTDPVRWLPSTVQPTRNDDDDGIVRHPFLLFAVFLADVATGQGRSGVT